MVKLKQEVYDYQFVKKDLSLKKLLTKNESL